MFSKTQAILISLSASLSIWATPVAAKEPASDVVAKVITSKGQVAIERQQQTLPAKRKDNLQDKDKVTTGEKARAQFRFNDGTLTTLGANSEMTINKFDWQPDAESPSAEFTLVKGVFRTVTGLITKVDDPNYKVNTPMGSIGIRGTDFWGGYLDEGAIDVLFVDGEHTIEVSNEFGTVILEKPGQGTTIKPGAAPSKPKTWPSAKVQRAVKTISLDE